MQLPRHVVKPAAQKQLPPKQTMLVDGQPLRHTPQFEKLVVRSTHPTPRPQSVNRGEGQTHFPCWQVAPCTTVHRFRHEPQLSLLVLRSTHPSPPPHGVRPSGQKHSPCRQGTLGGQAFPQEPQFLGSLARF
jgi:hypothetical protein